MVETPKIKKLPEHLINQIAAGEVIERPASAVKELLDNAIDAGAKSIQVQILSSDARSFRVTDDGCGIDPEQLELAFSKHATSKIASLDDLNQVTTKGFRGEALASIASIAQVTCLTKHAGSAQAVKATFNKDGKLIKTPAAFNKGTSFEIRDLFGNVPVRLKFMKRPETELGILQDMVRESAIAHPDLSIELKNKDKTIFKTSGSGNWELAVREALGEKIDFKYLEFKRLEKPEMELRGLVAPLSEARSDRRSVITIVNQRPIQCEIMRKAIKSVYSGFLPSGKFPRLILSLQLPADQIDVNVHPTKREVRYSEPQLLYSLIQNALEKHLIINSSLAALPKELKKNEAVEPVQQSIEISDRARPALVTEAPTKFKLEALSELRPSSPRELNPQVAQQPFQAKEPTPTDTHVLRISELELRKIQEGQAPKKPFRAERSNSTDFALSSGLFYLTGQVHGPKWIRESYLQFLSEWLLNIDLSWDDRNPKSSQLETFPKLVTRRAKVSPATLNEVWRRDNWTCVYCGKKLLHPLLVKRALKQDPDGWITRMSTKGEPFKTHILREHQATYDHYLPVSHNPALSLQKENLLAACRACNQAKSNSTDQYKWKPQAHGPWLPEGERVLKVGNSFFDSPEEDARVLKPEEAEMKS